jgi:hypothetical protein
VAVHINWIAVILATLSSMVIGSLWYGKALFGRRRKLTLINVANDFVTLMVMALIIGLMKP